MAWEMLVGSSMINLTVQVLQEICFMESMAYQLTAVSSERSVRIKNVLKMMDNTMSQIKKKILKSLS